MKSGDFDTNSEISQVENSVFKISKDKIELIIQSYLNKKKAEDLDLLNKLKGVEFLEDALCTSLSQGLNESEEKKEIRISEFDSNELPPEEPIRFCTYFWEALSDKIIIVLIIAAAVELSIGIIFGNHPKYDWIDGFTIIVAIAVVTLVGSINNYNKEIEFKKLKDQTKRERSVMIKRNGNWVESPEQSLLTGDIFKVESGMTIPCDSILIEGIAEIDESAMTGEIDPINKSILNVCLDRKSILLTKKKSITHHHEVESPILLSGTQVNNGDGSALVLLVGVNSENGKIRAAIDSNKSNEEGTPLEQKLSTLADKIGFFGLIAAIITSVGMAINLITRYFMGLYKSPQEDPESIINIFIVGIVVLVVAIPEGLPLAVTMTLSFSIGKMLQDNNFVRRMESCETMGNAEYICTDKTGTLTQNKMQMTRFYSFGSADKDLSETIYDSFAGVPEKYFSKDEWRIFSLSLACNTNTTFDADGNEKGNKSDESLTSFLRKFGVDVKALREEFIKPILNIEKPQINFTSARKKMSTLATSSEFPTGHRLFVKGASEIIINSCSNIRLSNGDLIEMNETNKKTVLDKIYEYANLTLRTFCIAFKEIDQNDLLNFEVEEVENNRRKRPIEESGLTLCGIIGIKDHLKEGVEKAVLDCKMAGITVIMITGDNIDTALAIAKSCSIASQKSQAILGDEFMSKIGGIVCENCSNKKEVEMNKADEGNKIDCSCPKTKDDWIIHFKQAKRKEKRLQSAENWNKLISDPERYKFYENELDSLAFEEFDKQGIKIRKDVIAKIDEFKKIVEDLRVIARSQPQHKYALVTGLREIGHVVAVTGDGTNDAPALSKADVGFAMDAGTDIAKEASDIIIKDNEFKSIVKAILWGRNIFDNIQRFLQFQLTVNVCACILVMVGSSIGQEPPLTAIQMLWVNMIMDSLGSLALAAEKPTSKLLNRNPNKRTDFIINRKMFKHIIGQSLFQLIVLFVLLFAGSLFIYEFDPEYQEISYTLKKCYPEAPIHFHQELKPENMFILSGMQTFFHDSIGLGLNTSECTDNKYFGIRHDNLKEAYKNVIDTYFSTTHYTLVFNTFVMMQLMNELCCRIIDDSINFLENITSNKSFMVIWVIEVVMQVIIIQFTGPVFNVSSGGLSYQHWIISLVLSIFTFVLNFILKKIPEGHQTEVQHEVTRYSQVSSRLRNSLK